MVSITLIPLLAAFFLKPIGETKNNCQTWLQWLLTPFRLGFEALEKGYGWLLDICLRNQEITLAIAAATIVLAFALYPFVPQEMMPLGNSGQFTVTIELEAGASFERANQVAQVEFAVIGE